MRFAFIALVRKYVQDFRDAVMLRAAVSRWLLVPRHRSFDGLKRRAIPAGRVARRSLGPPSALLAPCHRGASTPPTHQNPWGEVLGDWCFLPTENRRRGRRRFVVLLAALLWSVLFAGLSGCQSEGQNGRERSLISIDVGAADRGSERRQRSGDQHGSDQHGNHETEAGSRTANPAVATAKLAADGDQGAAAEMPAVPIAGPLFAPTTNGPQSLSNRSTDESAPHAPPGPTAGTVNDAVTNSDTGTAPGTKGEGAVEAGTEEPQTAAAAANARKVNILVVSSYHREYLWSQDTHRGLTAAMHELGYFDSREQGQELMQSGRVESTRAIVRKLWMDTKRRAGPGDISQAVTKVRTVVATFAPDILLLGDDNATNYIGNQYLDTDIPIVFWGVNGIPGKYGLIDALERPGHNVTGVYQAGYLAECVHFLKDIVPGMRTMAVLADDSPTSRAKAKNLVTLAQNGALPVELAATVLTNSASAWKGQARELAKRVDGFFVLNHHTLKDAAGRSVDPLEIAAWYLRNILKPGCSQERQFAVEGILATADDSGFRQGYEATYMAHAILALNMSAAEIPVRAPRRGALIVNRARARMLGIEVDASMGVEEYIDTALALERYPQ